MFRRLVIAFSCLQLCCICVNAQVALSGYVNNSSLVGGTRPDPFDETLWQNLTSQRLNFKWRINNFDLQISSQTTFSFGNKDILNLIKSTSTEDHNLLKLSYRLVDDEKKWLNFALDRVALRWSTEHFEISVGRQRINWGNTILWHPNDIFNSSPYINLIYPEKMGCDAVRASFFHNEVATSEIAVSADRRGSPTVAILHRNLFRKLDYQLLGGVYKGHFLFAGGGFTTELNSFNIRFEGSYFHDYRTVEEQRDIVQIAMGVDRVFKNNLIIQTELLYTNKPYDITDLILSYQPNEDSVRELTISRWSFAGQLYYPVSNLFAINSVVAYFPDQEAIYLGAGMNIHITKNLDASLMAHAFRYTLKQSYTMEGVAGTLQIKYFF